ncbi:MAG: pilus assembly PilX N-terminal domain-containing protein [Candidatus Pacebacteria bacterium]|nr:pilus assembly PilX N-terminal domain-containing protein [Candidatus Paceibacterota bacterium]
MIKKITSKSGGQGGDVLVYLLVIIFLFSIMMLPVVDAVVLKMKVASTTINKEEALQIAEAGIDYYQWHLAHYPSDYTDGTNAAGPYIHSYSDFDTQKVVGQYSLTITPPAVGSTVVTIQSTGSTIDNPAITRTVTAKYGIPSLAQYSFLSNDIIWIGSNETVGGQLMSNSGIRFDGVGNSPIGSAKATYTCPSSQGSPCPATENGVWGSADQATKNFWQFPVPAVDFSTLTSNLASLKSSAQNGGIYLPPSNSQGYSLVFNNNGTVSVYKVTSLVSEPTGWDVYGNAHNENFDYKNRTLQYTKSIPSNGIIYIEDKIWVEGTVNGRVMVAAALLPYNSSTAPTIYIPNNILYSAKDGSSVLGLLSQGSIVVTYGAPNNLEIDAALIAQNGSAQFYYYKNNVVKNSITVFGSIMTFGQWTWSWVDSFNNVVSGYANTTDTYDSNLLFYPPPSFPTSSSGYQQISWTSN